MRTDGLLASLGKGIVLVLLLSVFAWGGCRSTDAGGVSPGAQATAVETDTVPTSGAGGILRELPLEIPPFDAENDAYVLLAWNDLGMHCMTDAVAYWIFLPPANTLWVQLIERGRKPKIVTDNVVVTYRPEPGFETPSKHTEFWKYAKYYFGKELPLDTGVTGRKVTGEADLKPEHKAFVAELVPVVPYPDDGSFNPYPVFTIEAREKTTGRLLAVTKMVAPVSTEVGCRKCHTGEARFKGITGLADETAINILQVHDRRNRTDLLAKAQAGSPTLCQSCHADPALGAAGAEGVLNLSAAMHGFHAVPLANLGMDACNNCHPNAPNGRTRCLRDIHAAKGRTCLDCHGTLEDHALSLLKQEQLNGKKAADALMLPLMPRLVDDIEAIHPRTPWIHSPDCLACHVDFQQPKEGAGAFNQWTAGPEGLYRMRAATGGVMCAACHGSPHAVYPSNNPYGLNRDTIQPVQYQGDRYPIASNRNCVVCHKQAMEQELHHPNLLRPVRN